MWMNRKVASLSAKPEHIGQKPPVLTLEPSSRAALLAGHESVIGKGLVLVGELAAEEPLESLFIDGAVSGNINLPGSRVTVGPGGQVTADIFARDLIVCGAVTGNITASDRLEIRAGGTLTGNASSLRIALQDGAFVRGKVLVCSSPEELKSTFREDPEPATYLASIEAAPRKRAAIRPDIQSPAMVPSLTSA